MSVDDDFYLIARNVCTIEFGSRPESSPSLPVSCKHQSLGGTRERPSLIQLPIGSMMKLFSVGRIALVELADQACPFGGDGFSLIAGGVGLERDETSGPSFSSQCV
jgi:hypothetical protein